MLIRKMIVAMTVVDLVAVSLANGAIVSRIHILQTGVDSWGITLRDGMSSTLDGSGGYWALLGTVRNPVTGGSSTPCAPDASVILGDAGDSGLFDYGVGLWGYFGSSQQTWSATPGVFADVFINAASLYLISDDLTSATFVEHPFLTPIMVQAHAGGPYKIGPGETIVLDGSRSSARQGADDITLDQMRWLIHDKDVGEGQMLSISYNTLVDDLGLSFGVYQVKLLVTADWAGPDSDFATIEVVPEPCSFLLLAGGLLILKTALLSVKDSEEQKRLMR